MNETDNPITWANEAEDDLKIARISLRRENLLFRGACFHAQQCGEKYLKALLLHQQAEFPKVHDLGILNTLCNQAGIFTGFDKDALDTLSDHAVRTRYPGPPPTLEDAREALEIAKTIRKFARKWLEIK